MIRRILLALPTGEDGLRAVALTRTMSESGGSRVFLLRMEEWPVAGPSIGYGWTPSMRSGHLTAVRERLKGSRDEEGGRVLSRDSLSSDGVIEKAEAGRASLIVLPHRHEGWLDRLLHGGSAQRILDDSRVPVLAVPEDGDLPAGQVTRILFVHSGGQAAVQGARVAIDLAQLFEVPVCLLRTGASRHRSPGMLRGWLFGESRPVSLPDDPSALDTVGLLFQRRGVEARPLGAPSGAGAAEAVLAVTAGVREQGADLVVLARAHTWDRTADAVARQVLEELRVPLLLVRERPASDPSEEAPRFRLRL